MTETSMHGMAFLQTTSISTFIILPLSMALIMVYLHRKSFFIHLLFQYICMKIHKLLLVFQKFTNDQQYHTYFNRREKESRQRNEVCNLDPQGQESLNLIVKNAHLQKTDTETSNKLSREKPQTTDSITSSRIPWILLNKVILLTLPCLLVNVLLTIVSGKFPLFLQNKANTIYTCETKRKQRFTGQDACLRNTSSVLAEEGKHVRKLEKVADQHSPNWQNSSKMSVAELRRHLNHTIPYDPTNYNPCSTISPKRKDKYALFLPKNDHIVQVRIPGYPYLDQVVASHNTLEDMCYEMRRLMSFCGTTCLASSIRLAQSGFYFEGSGRQTRCFSCRALYCDWELMDRPDVIHRRLSPNCPHLTAGDVRNIAIDTGSVTEDHVSIHGLTGEYPAVRDAPDGISPISVTEMSVSDEQHTSTCVTVSATGTTIATSTASAPATTSDLDISKAVYPHYRDLQSRMNSYLGWEWSHVQDPRILAAAGVYYAGYRDCVRCFYCGVGLRTWEAENDPWVEHIRWRSSCGYVLCMKGDQFIISALAQPNEYHQQGKAKETIQITNEHVESAGTTQKILTVENTTNNASAASESQTHDDHQEMYQQSQLEEENQSLRDESTCKVCLDNPSCIVFLPCGHLVTCAECAPALRKCPVCRALIRGTVRAYME